MVESLLITLREGFEAALIVAIVLAYLRRTGRAEGVRAVWAGVAAAAALSIALGLALRGWFDGLEGAARFEAFAAIAGTAAVVLTWMIFWMRRQSRSIKGDLEGQIGEAVSTGSLVAIAGVAFFAVLREGIETALFLIAATTGADDRDVLIGGVIGLLGAIAVALVIYVGGHRLSLKAFFRTTGLLLIVFAAGLLSRAVQFLQAVGDIGSVNMAAYDVTGVSWLTVQTQVGRFLAGIFGWDPRPSVEQVVVYLAYLVPVLVFFLRGDTPRPAAVQPDVTEAPAPTEVSEVTAS